jgi:hypothetical protein
MSSYRNLKGVAAAAALIATIGITAMPAHAVLISNALTSNGLAMNALVGNALTAEGGSAIADLNGVTVEAVHRERIDGVEPAPGDKAGGILFDQLSQVDPGARW